MSNYTQAEARKEITKISQQYDFWMAYGNVQSIDNEQHWIHHITR